MLRSISLTFSLFLAAVSSAPALTLSLSEIGPRVRAAHPSLKAARMAVEEARGRQLGAGRLANPSVGLDTRNETYLSPAQVVILLDQSFPIT